MRQPIWQRPTFARFLVPKGSQPVKIPAKFSTRSDFVEKNGPNKARIPAKFSTRSDFAGISIVIHKKGCPLEQPSPFYTSPESPVRLKNTARSTASPSKFLPAAVFRSTMYHSITVLWPGSPSASFP